MAAHTAARLAYWRHCRHRGCAGRIGGARPGTGRLAGLRYSRRRRDHRSLRLELASIAVPTTTGGGNMAGDDFAVSVGWGHFGTGEAVMPGHGKVVGRDYTDDERTAMSDAIPTLGGTTFDVYLNDRAYWRNVPRTVWNYQLGGYQVLKKWLSYRERKVLDRPAAAGRGTALH